MSVLVLLRLYKRMTNLPMHCRTSSGLVLSVEYTFSNASVKYGSTAQMVQAVFLPCQAKLDTVLHPVPVRA